jgi:membrane-bound lytic murein transglycosylase B
MTSCRRRRHRLGPLLGLLAGLSVAASPVVAVDVPAAPQRATQKTTHKSVHGKARASAKPAHQPRGATREEGLRHYAEHPSAMQFAAEVAARRGWDLTWVERHVGRAQLLPAVQRLIMPPPAGTAKNWAAYRARFIEPTRIQAGLRFWDNHAALLERAEAQFGVPAEIVIGILGVETFYGRIMGDFRALDALATLSFDFPPGRRDRSDFFRGELEELLAFAQRDGIDPRSLKGSYAGALGLPQFMPGSINRYAVDYDGDGRIDLRANAADVIGSVASYLAAFGWQRGMPTHFDVAPPVDTTARARLLVPDILPSFSAQQMSEAGARLGADAQSHAGPLALVELQNGDAAPSFVAGTQNFYTVTRYNWSSYYALAVIELGQEVAKARRNR